MRRWSAAGACGPALAVALIALAAPASASAAITSVLSGQTISGNPIACSTQADGVRVCQGTDGGATTLTDTRLRSFDGVPLALYVILPPRLPRAPTGITRWSSRATAGARRRPAPTT